MPTREWARNGENAPESPARHHKMSRKTLWNNGLSLSAIRDILSRKMWKESGSF